MRLVATLLMLSAAAPATARAQATVEARTAAPARYQLMVDVTPGVDQPLGDRKYAGPWGASFTLDGHIGLVVWMHGRRYALVPELSIGGTALASTGPTGGFGPGFSRVRGEAALRVLVPVHRFLAVYGRVGVGGDYLTGAFTSATPDYAILSSATASSFLCDVGVGLLAAVGPHLAFGLYAGVPVTPRLHMTISNEFVWAGQRHTDTTDETFTAVDLTIAAVAMLRL